MDFFTNRRFWLTLIVVCSALLMFGFVLGFPGPMRPLAPLGVVSIGLCFVCYRCSDH